MGKSEASKRFARARDTCKALRTLLNEPHTPTEDFALRDSIKQAQAVMVSSVRQEIESTLAMLEQSLEQKNSTIR